MTDSSNRREITERNLPSESLGVNQRIYLHCLLVRCVTIVARANGITGQNDLNLRSRLQNLELSLHVGVPRTLLGLSSVSRPLADGT
jgi:hypothetical protein